MKLVSYRRRDQECLGVLDLDHQVIRPLLGVDGSARRPTDAVEVLAATTGSGPDGYRTGEETVALADVELLAPLGHPPRNVLCVGKNYAEHAGEFDRSGYDASAAAGSAAVPDAPIVFTKPATCIIGPGAAVDPHANLTKELDYEAEIAVIIGRGGAAIDPEAAWDHVWGLTLVNDITARDLQQRHRQWFLGKCLDTFLPMGPWAVSLDEVDVDEIVLEGHVNGELRQRASFRELIFDVPTIIATVSAGMALQPGDIIATGTPAGVGIGFDPPRFLNPGDEVVVSATGLGALTNTVAEPEGAR